MTATWTRSLVVGALSAAIHWSLAGAPLAQSGGGAPDMLPSDLNVLVIVLDDVGSDKLRLFDDLDAPPYARTPRLNELALGGIRFESFYVNPICSATRALLQTGRYAFRTGMGSNTESYRLPDSELLLAELLHTGLAPERAYRCGAFGKWHLGAWDPAHAVTNGYDHFSGNLVNLQDHFDWQKIEHDAGAPPSPPQRLTTWNPSVTRADAVRWINAQDRPFFAWIGFNPPHAPWQVPPLELLSNRTRAELSGYVEGERATRGFERRLFYRAMLEAVDTEIGRLLDGIDPWKRARTMVFVVCDNGVAGQLVQPPHDTTHGKPSVYQLGIRVPMIVSGPLVPGPVPPGGHVCDELVQGADLWRTIAELTGADPDLAFQQTGVLPPYPSVDGASFVPLILDPGAAGPTPWIFSELFGPPGLFEDPTCLRVHMRAITDGQFKFIRNVVKEPGTPPCDPPLYRHELYRVGTDGQESVNLLTAPLTPEERAVLAFLSAQMDALGSESTLDD